VPSCVLACARGCTPSGLSDCRGSSRDLDRGSSHSIRRRAPHQPAKVFSSLLLYVCLSMPTERAQSDVLQIEEIMLLCDLQHTLACLLLSLLSPMPHHMAPTLFRFAFYQAKETPQQCPLIVFTLSEEHGRGSSLCTLAVVSDGAASSAANRSSPHAHQSVTVL